MENSASSHQRAQIDTNKLSLWTVVGAVAASVLTAGILGGASGILQIPTIITDVASLRSGRESNLQIITALSERVRSAELTQEGLQRQLNEVGARASALVLRIDKQDADSRSADITLNKELALLEGRSKDRNTEVKGEVLAVQSALGGLAERLRSSVEAQNALRQNVYDLAIHISKQPLLSPQAFPVPVEPSPYSTPFKKDNDQQLPSILRSPLLHDALHTER